MKKAKIFYLIGSILLILVGVGHFFGQFEPKGLDIQRSLVEQAMKEYSFSGFGFQYSMIDVMQCWGVFFGVLMLVFGALNLLILSESLLPVSMIRFSLFNIAGLVVLIFAGAIYVPFTAVGFSVVLLCFVVSAILFYKKKKENG